ncbi:alanine racemase [Aliidiomarina celeris]|uniref:alanine racemase n=1 Tax=Aliidiomarina celeris TaxID=2249428 RepID=UPI000DEB4CD2|nr:alanine racemase [Aliidiomarina celeris]
MKLNWSTLTRPSVLVDRSKAQRNINTMQAKAAQARVALRPHFKTHQSIEIGQWFGTPAHTPIAVSSVTMAQQFAEHGWRNIHIAIPLNPRELPALNSLASYCELTLTIEHEDTLATLQRLRHPVHVVVEIDTGYGRTGLDWQQHPRIRSLLNALAAIPQVHQRGVMVHSGHSYGAEGEAGIQRVHNESSARLMELLQMLPKPEAADEQRGFRVSVGDTPTCSRMSSFPGATEIRPGNYVFYDLQQKYIGACEWSDIALAVACPVIARYPERNEVVVHGGAVHFSKDAVETPEGRIFGQVMHRTEHGWGAPLGEAQVIGLSQEHGKIRMPASMVRSLKLGDLLVIVPAHSCLTMAAMGDFTAFDSM